MRHLDLFSGIGGFSLGLEATGGFRTVGFVEWEEYPKQVLRKHWPDVPVMGDIRDVKGDEFGEIDIITGGFPCQPFSCAGKRGGEGDDRYLWPEMLRVIDTAKPSWVIGENVAGIIKMALDTVLDDLEAIGYTCRPVVIPACAVGAPHRRDRVWILAYCECTRSKGGEVYTRNVIPTLPGGETSTFVAGCERLEDVADTEEAKCKWCRHTRDRRSGSSNSGGSTGGTGNGRLESGLGGMAYGLPGWLDEPVPRTTTVKTDRAKRLKGLGNAVVPQVVYELGRAILAVEKEVS